MEKSYRIEKSDSKVHWDEFVLEHGGHPLQLWGWGDLKTAHNWSVERFFVIEDDVTIGAVQLLIRKLPKPFGHLLYVPRGPVIVGDTAAAVYEQLVAYAKRSHKAVALTVEPVGDQPPAGEGWIQSTNTILPSHTLLLDLKRPEGSLLADMSSEVRDAIREAGNQQLTIKRIGNPDDITDCLDIYKQTAERQAFHLRKDQYYYDLQNKLGENSALFGCYENDQLVAFLWLALSESVAFELYGGASERGMELQAAQLLRWETIRRMKQWGIDTYDLGGVTDHENDTARGFSADTFDHTGTFDIAMSPLYSLWRRVVRMRKGGE